MGIASDAFRRRRIDRRMLASARRKTTAAHRRPYSVFPGDNAIAPGLWWYEMRNIMISSERRGRIDSATSNRALTVLKGLPITLDHQTDDAVLMGLARDHKLTAYDAAYLELALRENVSLATLDEP